ncbi:flagellar hook-associated protein FlgK [Fervidibacillus halotolerans]|uniref:Flagellar hook-associated protein 1 n=1 Tax=Fervidibacillus halotolerans TaxID=2980027 RepID=A0A9E8LYF3_9BACI|nr:flagellar hook-associated protein FlgK [Fervidibacillus halotolerans]WAA12027.1 flagellar hook-associated protein FlgK [Fervidibacillus halotolerans]
MIPTFHGLETAKRGLNTQQTALYTTSHNIANANTEGYTRQRVNFTQTTPFPGTGMNRPQIPGQIGTGVQAGSIERVRESFLDAQYRLENNKFGYYSTLSTALSKMEDIMNEPTDSGLHSVMEQFWNSLQDLANHPENTGARQVVISRGEMVADTIRYYYNSLVRIQTDLGNEINVKVNEINSIISQIGQLNEQIASVEPHGQLPNDLYDKRDELVDQLSKMINIKVTNVVPKNYGQALPTAVGLYNIEIVQSDGSSYSPQATLLHVDQVSGRTSIDELKVVDNSGYSDALRGPVDHILIGDQTLDQFNFSGELSALIESYGYMTSSGDVEGLYPDMLEKLNHLTEAFVKEFNFLHREGFDINGVDGKDFFHIDDPHNTDSQPAAASIQVIITDPAEVAAGYVDPSATNQSKNAGNNENAKRLANIKTKDFSGYEYIKAGGTLPAGLNGSFDTYYASIIGDLGVQSQSATKDMENTQVLVDSVEYNRQSVSGVSLDEEMTNIIKFQHAYNASARMITVIDEMLDKIINGMGVVGR